MIKINQLVQVNFVVSDVERSVAFYTELLGARIVRDWWGETSSGAAMGFDGRIRFHAYMLRWGEGDELTFPQLDILEWIEPPGYGESYESMNHIGIPRIAVEVTDVVEAYDDLRAQGVEFVSPPMLVNPNTRRGSKTMVCCLKDPDGIFVELIGPLGMTREGKRE